MLVQLAGITSMLAGGCGQHGECWDKFGMPADGNTYGGLYPVGDCTPHAYHQDTWVPTFKTTGTCPGGHFSLPRDNEWEDVWRHTSQNGMGGHIGSDVTGLHP